MAGCGPKKEQAAPDKPGVPVSVITIKPVDLDEKVDVTGSLQPTSEVTVGCRYAGRIGAILVKEGTPVKRGMVVARMEQQDNEAQLASAKAAVRAAQAHLEQAKAAVLQQKTATDSGIQTARAGVDAAKAKLNQARVTADSTEASMQAGVKAAQAALDVANSRLTELKNGSRSQERAVAENQVAVAKANLDGAQRDYTRYKDLFDQGAVARSQLDKYETALAVARAQYNSALQQLSLVKEGSRQEDIDAGMAAVRQAEEGLASARANLKQIDIARANVQIADTGVEQAQAALSLAIASRHIDVMRDKDVQAAVAALAQAKDSQINSQNLLNYTDIVSPVDGVVVKKVAEAGQSVAANISILTISTNGSLYFEASVSELQATHLRSGQPVLLAVDALQGDPSNIYGGDTDSGRHITGMVERVVPVVDAHTRNFNVRITVPRAKDLYPGMFARGSIIVMRHPQCVAVPKDAMLEKDGQQVVFVANNGTARKCTIKPGVSDGGNYVQAISGVSLGDQVITIGQQSLQDGDKVKVLK